MTKYLAIIHYNTPELTEAAILSLRKHGGDDVKVVVFDNSDECPFKRRMKGVKCIDNTKGQEIDFGDFLSQYPDREKRYAMLSNFGSAKHARSVQELWRILPEGFVLMESDVIIKKDISFLWMEDYAAAGKVQWHQPGNKWDIPRLLPMLCWLNVPLLEKYGAKYFDPQRCWALQKGVMTRGNWYDVGASLLEDIRRTKPELVARNIANLGDYYSHFGGGSWKEDLKGQSRWLEEMKAYW